MLQPTTSCKKIYLIRHGATAWSESGQHTGTTDLSLEAKGIEQSKQLAKRLKTIEFSQIFCSPLKRAQETCKICGYNPIIDSDLVEWNYGAYEGKTTEEIGPTWSLFRDGAPKGETVAQVQSRASRFLQKLEKMEGNIGVFSSGHFLRMVGLTWIQAAPILGQSLVLSTASISILGYEHTHPAIICWNDISHSSML